ncbi:hypothetical protein [Bradyrhizobium sp. STM 3566]|uniref:hypothetical protein n=1 Tax=Bradyrhizobium sp. STM 3566 TaxID=578928 RepID=UPI00388E1BE7
MTRAGQCGQQWQNTCSIHHTIFELLARLLDGHEDRCSFQDMIAQELDRVPELQGYSAHGRLKREVKRYVRFVVSETEANDIVATFATIVSRAKQGIVAENESYASGAQLALEKLDSDAGAERPE